MSIQFGCPQCQARVEVGDEFAGQVGQCPRCQSVIAIPSADEPVPAEPEPPQPAVAKPKRPPADAARRPRRVPPAPAAPRGPIWPWAVGCSGALVIAGLLVSSFAVLVFWRKPERPMPRVAEPLHIKAIDMPRP